MSALTDFLENRIIDAMFRGQSYSFPATLHFALFTAAPGESGGGTEVSAGGYARVPAVASLANFAGTQGAGTTTASSGTSGTTSNNGAIQFASPTANWGTVIAVGIFDAATGGNMLVYAPLTTPKTVNNGDAAPLFPASTFSFGIN